MREVYFPLGHPVEVVASDQAVLDAAERSWGPWKQLFDACPIHVEVNVTSSGEPAPSNFVSASSHFEIRTPSGHGGRFTQASRRACLSVSPEMLADEPWFRYHLLEATVLTALDSVAFTPVHAACIARHGQVSDSVGRRPERPPQAMGLPHGEVQKQNNSQCSGILLCGDSGAGKSSLAYACARKGWTFISDDASHAVTAHPGTVVGNPFRLLLREALFRELEGRPVTQAMNGKPAIVINPSDEPGLQCAPTANVTACVFLERRPGPPVASRRSPESTLEYFCKYLCWGDPIVQQKDLHALVNRGCWTLAYEHLTDAIAALEAL